MVTKKKYMTKLMENEKYLTEQIITYIGNKRSLLDFIEEAVEIVRKELNKNKLDIADLFSGSGIVARYLKKYSNKIITNDLENYSYTLNKCYLSNENEINTDEIVSYYNRLKDRLEEKHISGFITKLYAPEDDGDIKKGERVFYTNKNARYIDTCRQTIATFPVDIQHFFIAPLLTEASIKNNTGGVFKGFYKNRETGIGQFGGTGKNALSRIKADIDIPFPVFSNFNAEVINYQCDANALIDTLEEVDLLYLDPPYNQHPYGSNYFMLNLINDYIEPENISEVSGIPEDWNRSGYNKKNKSLNILYDLCKKAKAKYILISFNSEGFITKEQMEKMLKKTGTVRTLGKKYNTYRASRNLNNRNTYVHEYLFLVKKS
ncbi:MAG TPA: DNA adenine methylase [Clostridia bacterium]|jgi:adenine-specific DNA-methyltransferase|nr:DNA adenine methylase [Clostridia bacterium]